MKRRLIISVLILTGAVCSAQTPTMNVYQSGGSLLQLPLSNIDSVLFETVPPPSTMVIYQTGGTINSIVVSSIDSITYTVYNTPPPPQNGDWLNPNISYGSVTDIDGNVYPTVVIGNQEWMAENLRTTRYSNGDLIPNVQDYAEWNNLSSGAWAHYNNNNQAEIPCGKLYNGFVKEDIRNVCPIGWHVPTLTDFGTLITYVDPDAQTPTNTGMPGWYSSYNALDELMSTWNLNCWDQGNHTNATGFSGLACGARDSNEDDGGGYFGNWWSDTEIGVSTMTFGLLCSENVAATLSLENYYVTYGLSIRCVRD